MVTISHESHVPLYIQLEEYLRSLITQEEYRQGKLLPGENELAVKFGVSRNTIRAAMDKLVYEGLITRKQGVGTIVNERKIHTTLEKWNGFSDEMRAKGIHPVEIEHKVKWVKVDGDEAFALGVKAGKTVCRLQRLRAIDGKPAVLFISYFPAYLGIREDEQFEGKLYNVLKENYGATPAVSEEEIGALAATEELSAKLEVPVGTPLLSRCRKVYDPDERLIELCYSYYRADKFVYNVRIRKESL